MYGARNGKDEERENKISFPLKPPSSIKISRVLRVIPKKQNK